VKVLIVDDEQLARDRLARMLADLPGYDVVGQAANGMQAVQGCESTQPDVVLLDIRMPGMDGLEAARHMAGMEQPPAVVFCTAYEEHAIEAFKVQAVGYLLKPVRRDDLIEVLGSATRTNRAQLAALAQDEGSQRSHISARTRKGIELVPIDAVRFFQADQKYVTMRHAAGELLIDETLAELELEFGVRFVRVHRNALVATKYIEGLERNEEGQYQIRLRDVPERIDISRRHVSSIRRYIQKL
jgi:two-component system, LytTR family, response regulator AlgR